MRVGTSPPPLPRKPRNWLPAIVVTCVFSPFLILLIVFISYRVSNASAVRRLEAEIKRKGEPLTLADLAARYPPIPDENNGAVLLLQLWEEQYPEYWKAFMQGEPTLPQRNEAQWNKALPWLGADARRIWRTQVLMPENLTAAARFLSERKEHLNRVRVAIRKPQFRFPIRFDAGYQALLPHLSQMKMEAQSFRIEALLIAERGELDRAIEAMENVARTGNVLTSEPFMISQLSRVSCYSMVLDAAERLLSLRSLSGTQLDKLEVLSNQLQTRGSLRLAFETERVAMLNCFSVPDAALPESSSRRAKGELAATPEDSRLNLGALDALGLADLDWRLMMETMREAIALADQDNPKALKRMEELFGEANSKASRFPRKLVSSIFLPSLNRAAPRIASLEARRRAATVALAIEHFRLASGGLLPENIEVLVPQYLAFIPSDPFDGEPLRYKKLPTGFVVYSIGTDRKNDGGKERPQKGAQNDFDVTFIVER